MRHCDASSVSSDVFCARKEILPFLAFAAQLMISNLARLALTVVDSAFVGHLGTTELAAASLASLWTQCVLYTVTAMASALVALCGQAYGAKNYLLMGVWLQMALLLIAVLMPPTLYWYWSIDVVVQHATDDAAIVALGSRFGRILSASAWPLLVYVCLCQYLQALGVVTPTTINGIVCIGIDVGANYLLIYTAGLGFDGSPLATVIAAWFQPIALFLYAFVYKKYHRGAWGGWKLSELTWSRWKTFFRMALPLGLNDGCTFLYLAVLSLIVATLGSDAIAANAIFSNLWVLLQELYYSIGCAAEVRIAAHLGGRRPTSAKATAFMAVSVATSVAALVAIGFFVGARGVIGIFTSNDALLALCIDALPLYIGASLMLAVETVLSCTLEGMGQMGFVSLPLAYYFGITNNLGLSGVWLGCCVGGGAKTVVFAIKLATVQWSDMVTGALVAMEIVGGDDASESKRSTLPVFPRTILVLA
ncbi:hypothetical protein SDRG_04759 [Saprolegnia diclina VS20]|uniref:MATE efflux family protein n=1 Tax=Saprolegnia diclina (strain VS20) TaxID=1156394 RepID=T0S4Q0_SAPDV|nr:hypothetical protein SDRG_04759 [Saprolegnia diclina VS20]EQC37732.1 hypothetical protein SDRG_04759 [Saprolegnia diclina VS20]|eukprot:XP_008608665.1 hypothetical protein SDRG_04759 [Saprolegnia diclina VS20]